MMGRGRAVSIEVRADNELVRPAAKGRIPGFRWAPWRMAQAKVHRDDSDWPVLGLGASNWAWYPGMHRSRSAGSEHAAATTPVR